MANKHSGFDLLSQLQSLAVGSTASIAGPMYVTNQIDGSTLALLSLASINGTLNANNQLNAQTLAVTSNASITGSLNVYGDLYARSTTWTNTVRSPDSTTVRVPGQFAVTSTASIGGNLTLSGTLSNNGVNTISFSSLATGATNILDAARYINATIDGVAVKLALIS